MIGRSGGGEHASLQRITLPALVVTLTSLAFLPALDADFVNWDDHENLLKHDGYRGLGWRQLHWMFTTTLLGHYIPLTWLTFGLNYALGGLRPWGYHFANIVLHAANAALFYFIARRLLAAGTRGDAQAPERALGWAAALAAVGWGVHPLRAESVAWVTERRDVLCGLFFLLAVLGYLRAVEGERAGKSGRLDRRWLLASLAAFAAALLSKAIAMTLPLVLLLLDVYPLRRPVAWRRLIEEKVPYLILAAIGAATALWAVHRATVVTAYGDHGIGARVAMAGYGFAFYPWKWLWPAGLSPLYELPARVELSSVRFALPALAVVSVTVVLVLLRRQWPAGLAAWLHSAIVLAPVSGVVHAGFQLAHDRYSYLSGMGFALLIGAALWWALAASPQRAVASWVRGALVGALSALVMGWAAGAWAQSQIWRDSETLWRAALEVDPACAICHSNLGQALLEAQRLREAESEFRHAITGRPERAAPHHHLGIALALQGRQREAEPEFREAMRREPRFVDPLANLGALYGQERRYVEAIPLLRQAFAMRPEFPGLRASLAQALKAEGVEVARQGRLAEATALFHEASRVARDDPDALRNLGQALVEQGKGREAMTPLERAVALDPRSAPNRFWLARAYLLIGDAERARAEVARLREMDPGLASQVLDPAPEPR